MIIEFWYRSNGKSRAERFLEKLDDYERLRVVDLIEAFEKPHWTLSRMVSAGELKPLGGGLYELKVRSCGSFYRFPSVAEGDNLILLLDGFKKQKNKLEKKDIERAKALHKEYKNQ